MSLRIPNAPMEGLSIDVKKFASDASTFFNRARQFTEEQLGQGMFNIYSLHLSKANSKFYSIFAIKMPDYALPVIY